METFGIESIGKYWNEIHWIKVERRGERGSIGGMDW